MVRTPGAQPATIHPTRSFAMLHLAIRGAGRFIDRTPRLIRASSQEASQEAAAASGGSRPPRSRCTHRSARSSTPSSSNRWRKFGRRGEDRGRPQSGRTSPAAPRRVPTTAPRRRRSSLPSERSPAQYQSTPPNFPSQPQFTSWPHVKPFALERASQFRPGPPPALESDAYADALNEIKSLGTASGSTASADQALTGDSGTAPSRTTGTRSPRRRH